MDYQVPEGFRIYHVGEYDPNVFQAANLLMEKHDKPLARYVAILASDTGSVPALGDTPSGAINAAISKVLRDLSLTGPDSYKIESGRFCHER